MGTPMLKDKFRDVVHALAFGIIASALALAIIGVIAAAFLAVLVLA